MAGYAKFAQATQGGKHSRWSATIRESRSYKLRQNAFLIYMSLKKCLTAIAHGFKCGPEVINNLGTNFNEGGNE